MLTLAAFSDAILAVHIIGVMVAFGVTFSYPVLALVGNRERRAMPALHRAQHAISRMIINPGLVVILLAGIYLASHEHAWSAFYVQWGIAAVIVLGGAEGGLVMPREARLAKLAERDVAASGQGEVRWSAEYTGLVRQTAVIGAVLDVIVVLTIFFMALHVGGH